MLPAARRALLAGIGAGIVGGAMGRGALGQTLPAGSLDRLVRAYPDHLAAWQGDALIWRDGTRMPIGAGLPARDFEAMLLSATVADGLRQTYRPGPVDGPPPRDHSPGRIRNTAFFLKMYGDCRAGGVPMRPVAWMPHLGRQSLSVTAVNDVAGRLERVVQGLEALPDRYRAWLVPSAGTMSCRPVADTGLVSMHGYGAAIDIATRQSDYWHWARGEPSWRNRIPFEIVEAFEAERFIWGGKWFHYDTMHFEYRPELFPSSA